MLAAAPQPCAGLARLRGFPPYGNDRRVFSPVYFRRRCRSSVVEHPLGKGEVVSSILTGSTRNYVRSKPFARATNYALGKREQNKTQICRSQTCKIRAIRSLKVLAFFRARPRRPGSTRCAYRAALKIPGVGLASWRNRSRWNLAPWRQHGVDPLQEEKAEIEGPNLVGLVVDQKRSVVQSICARAPAFAADDDEAVRGNSRAQPPGRLSSARGDKFGREQPELKRVQHEQGPTED